MPTTSEAAPGILVGQGDGPRVPVGSGGRPSLHRPIRVGDATVLPVSSGGRDSFALLAILVDEARRAGLSKPVAITARLDEDEASDECAWSEEAVRATDVAQWG